MGVLTIGINLGTLLLKTGVTYGPRRRHIDRRFPAKLFKDH